MARNYDGTIVKKVRGALATSVTGTSSVKMVTHAFKDFNGGGGGLVYAGVAGNRKRGWRIVSRTER